MTVVKYHDQNSNLRKKGFILAYGSREIESIMAGKSRLGDWSRKQGNHISPTGRKEEGREERKWSGSNYQSSPLVKLSPVSLCLLRVLWPLVASHQLMIKCSNT